MKPKLPQPSGESAIVRRVLSLPVGFGYIFGLAFVASQIFRIAYPYALAIVLVAAVVQIGLLIAFGVRLSRVAPGESRFRISTVLLVTAYLSIYLAAIRAAVSSVLDVSPPPRYVPEIGIGVLIVGGGFIVISTLVLLTFAESLMWFAVAIVRYTNGQPWKWRRG